MEYEEIISEEVNAQTIMKFGLQQTAHSLAIMIGAEVKVDNMKFVSSHSWSLNRSLQHGSNYVILKTELMGSVAGINYFLISQEDVKSLCGKCISEEIAAEDSEDSKIMMIEFMKELENIMAAATISTIADSFKMDLFGDVPKIQALDFTHISGQISRETSNLNPVLTVCCSLDIPEMNISPDFIWFFNDAFTQRLNRSQSEVK